MKSIRASLIVGSVAGTLAVLGVTGVVVYRGAARILVRQLDDGLANRAGNCAAVTKQTPEGFEFEIEDIHMPEFTTPNGTGYLEVWAADDSVLFRSPNLASRDIAEVPAHTEGRPAFAWIQTPDGKRVRAAELRARAVVDPDDWDEAGLPMPAAIPIRCVVALDAGEIETFLSRLRAFLIALGTGSCGVAALVLAVVVRNSLRPLDRLAGEIAALDDTDLAARVSLAGSPREIAPVVEQLNEWLARLERAFERERTFSADVAHELRTPLAGLRSTVEVAMSHSRDEAGHRQTYEELLAIIRRLQSMVETLLYLGRLESGHVNIERVHIDLAEFAAMTWESFEDAAREGALTVTRDLPDGIVVVADPVLLAVAVRNLFDNAVTYADRGGRIRIAAAREGGHGALRVVNSGSKVPAGDVDGLTQRFARIDPARRASGDHFGLGLALVSRIADALGGTLKISSTEGGEFVATLALRR